MTYTRTHFYLRFRLPSLSCPADLSMDYVALLEQGRFCAGKLYKLRTLDETTELPEQ